MTDSLPAGLMNEMGSSDAGDCCMVGPLVDSHDSQSGDLVVTSLTWGLRWVGKLLEGISDAQGSNLCSTCLMLDTMQLGDSKSVHSGD